MKTSFTLGLILASLFIVAKTNARPNRSESSLSTEEHVRLRYENAEQGRTFGSRRRARHSRQTSLQYGGPVWDIVGGKAEAPSDDDDDEGLRPISLKPSKQEIPVGVRAPPVEHGSIQSDISQTTQKPLAIQESKPKLPSPTKCQAAVLSCCRFDETTKKKCFEHSMCSKTYATGKACLPEVINMVIKIFTTAYGPKIFVR